MDAKRTHTLPARLDGLRRRFEHWRGTHRAPTKTRPACETRTSSVWEMVNSVGSVPSPCR